ncbi:MAG: oxygen-independent coproporphyrinogen III oxidase [Alphaproteobacteria bacterium]|nr:oxygen-independent coproporphyrinogen III oxidase [Alphaproteobacteria bacterium]
MPPAVRRGKVRSDATGRSLPVNKPVSLAVPDADAALVARRAAALPRYTSYPTANHFGAGVGAADYRRWLAALPEGAALSLYLHIPFCDTLCWYCACSTRATRRYEPVARYLDALEAEIAAVSALAPARHRVTHIHWGGGSPDILTPADIARLAAALRARFAVEEDAEFAVEVDPRLMTAGKADALAAAGVTRISVGVQDFDPAVQQAIGRLQGVEVTREAIGLFRARGVRSVNVDLVYGLPRQTEASLAATVEQVLALAPDRIAVFGYAHLPRRVANQKLIDGAALPGAVERFAQSRLLAERLAQAGYVALGLDHFARPDDALATGALHRNFQGYTTDRADALIGLGASAIGLMPRGYVQNAVAAADYAARVAGGGLATVRGWALSDDDRARGFAIERLMCDFALSLDAVAARFGGAAAAAVRAVAGSVLADDEDGFVERTADGLRITERGRPFVRHVCARFDAYLDPEGGARHSLSV